MQTKYTREQLIELAPECFSIRQLLFKLGLTPVGGNYFTMKKYIKLWNIDISHFTGRRWNIKDESGILRQNTIRNTIPLEKILVSESYYQSSQLRKRLIKKDLLKDECSKCGLKNLWQNEPITLHLDHINGIKHDNRLENLRVLCPNCHSQTKTFGSRNKNRNKYIQNIDNSLLYETPEKLTPLEKSLDSAVLATEDFFLIPARKCKICSNAVENKKHNFCSQECRKTFTKSNYPDCIICGNKTRSKKFKYCSYECSHRATYRTLHPSAEELQKLLWEKPTLQIAKDFGVSDKSIEKWAKQYNLSKPPRGYWAKKQFGKI